MNFRLNPLSAMTSRSRGSRPRTWLSSHRPPSRSCWSAVVTHNAQISPSESTRMNRLRPFTFLRPFYLFSPVVPALTTDVGRLDRPAIDPPGRRLGQVPGLGADILAEPVVDPLPQPGPPPQGEVVEDGLVVGEVVGEQFPRRPAPR